MSKKSVATLLVEIAKELYIFGSIATGRTNYFGETPEPWTYAAPIGAPEHKRPLADIRDDLAAVYAAEHGCVPHKGALGDAMTVLEGLAKQGERVEVGENDPVLDLFGADTIATRLVRLAKEHYRFGVTTTGDAFAVPVEGPNVARPLRGGRRSLRHELARIYYEAHRKTATSSALTDALLVLEGEANGTDPVEVALRVGRAEDGRLVLDLGTDDGRAVVIGPDGWDLVASSPVRFWRTNATLPLPTPVRGGDLDGLRDMLNIGAADWPLVLAWLVAALVPDLPHPVLLLRGEHGTAKSSAARLLTMLLDPCASQLRTAPRDLVDWCVAAAGGWITCLDNVSNLPHWLQDAICRAVTGDGLLRRMLYTDSDVSVIAFRRVVALTSVDPGPINGDLADRQLLVELERISEEKRTSEKDLESRWRGIHSAALGGLLNFTVQVLARLPDVRDNDLPRMADFARLVLAVDLVLGTRGYARYVQLASTSAQTSADADPVCLAICELIHSTWEGTAGQLLKLLTPEEGRPPHGWPTTPEGMAGRLTRAAPTLRKLGWAVDKRDRTGGKGARGWRLRPPGFEGVGNEVSALSVPSDTPSDVAESADTPPDGMPAADGSTVSARPDRQRVPPGHDGSDGADGRVPPPHCRECGQTLLLVRAGRDICERCRLEHGQAGGP